jgi:diguanylate cyclase (GGDEF)-like protein/PAS domain S-box-containing protein
MRLLSAYAAWMVALVVAFSALSGSGLDGVAVCLLGLSVLGAIVGRVVACRPARTVPWLLVAAAALCLAGSGIILWLGLADQAQVPSLDLDDVVGFLKYPLLAAALGLFARARSPGGDRRGLIDAATVTAGLVMLVWLFRILPALLDPSLSWEQRAMSAADSVGQIIVLLALARLLAPGIVWDWPVRLLALGATCGLAGSVAFGLLRAHHVHWRLVLLGWMACFALAGAAAVHPAMRELTRPSGRRQYEPSRARLVVLTVASFVAPALLIVDQRNDRREVAIVISAVLLWLLAQARLWAVNASQLRSLTWERALRAAGSALAAASSVQEIAAAVRTASGIVHGPRSGRAAVFATRVDGEWRVESATGMRQWPARLARTAPEWLPMVLPLLAGDQESDRPKTVCARLGDLEPVAGLGDLGSGCKCKGVLLCPVTVSGSVSADPLVGVFALFGDRWNVEARSLSTQIIANEVGLALERVLLTRELVRRESLEVFRELMQDASDAILILEDDNTVRYATPSARDIFGDIPFTGVNVWHLLAAAERELDPDRPTEAASRGVRGGFSELWRVTRHDGRTIRVRVKLSDLRDRPSVQGRVLTLRDVTEPRRLRDELRHRAFHDSLTGLPNRFLFADRTRHALTLAQRSGTVAAVLFLDLDDFKEVNDTLGHSVGDELLTAFGRRLAATARESDTTARIGGDEFALLVEDLADPAEADDVARRVLAAFAAPFDLSQGSVIMTATAGVATSDDSHDVDELMRHADLAMYAARAEGKHRWLRYSPVLSTGMQRRLEVRSALEKAISDSALELAYQPIVALGTGQIAGFESLVRWPHPEWGLLMPGEFIDIAEDTGLIVPLGWWVLRQALRDLAAERGPGAGTRCPPYVAVNVSARQFRAGGFMRNVREALDAAGLPPSALLLELTESALLRLEGNTGADLTELKRLGVRLAIDDFGTGYSSLSYLRELPIDILKIDRAFVDGIGISQQRLALAQGIVQIAQTLGIAVVAEGIETDEQCELLTEMGCEYGQGYLLAKPMAWPDARDLLRSGRPLTPARPGAESPAWDGLARAD